MNLEKCRARLTFQKVNHESKHATQKKLDASKARIDEYYRLEQDPEGIDFASFDPYTDSLAQTIYEAKK